MFLTIQLAFVHCHISCISCRMQLEILLQELGHDSRGQIYKKTISLVMLLMQQLILNEGSISVIRCKSFVQDTCFYLQYAVSLVFK